MILTLVIITQKRFRSHVFSASPWLRVRLYTHQLRFLGLTRKKIKGDFPKDQTYHVQSFIAKREAELLANWESLNSENGAYLQAFEQSRVLPMRARFLRRARLAERH